MFKTLWTSLTLKLQCVSPPLIQNKHVFYENKTMHLGLKMATRNVTGAWAFTAQI